jgi:hypothetical protein
VLGRWILLFPPGGDQQGAVIYLVLKYLWKQSFHQPKNSSLPLPRSPLHLSLFISILKFLETDSFSLCLHSKIDDIIAFTFLLLARGVWDGHLLLSRVCAISHLWNSEVNFVDSLMKHHHPCSVLGFALRTGLVDTILLQTRELQASPSQPLESSFIPLTSLWLSLLFPFSQHVWIQRLCSEPSSSSSLAQANLQPIIWISSFLDEEPALTHMVGSNKLLRHLQSNELTSIDDWCLLRTSQSQEHLPIRGKHFPLDAFESLLLWITQHSLNFHFAPEGSPNKDPLMGFGKTFRMVLQQSLYSSAAFFHRILALMNESLLLGGENYGNAEKSYELTIILLPFLKMRLEAAAEGRERDATLCLTIFDLLQLSLRAMKQSTQEITSLLSKLIETTQTIFCLYSTMPSLSDEISSLLAEICEIFLQQFQTPRRALLCSVVLMISEAVSDPCILLSSQTMILLTRTILEILAEFSQSPEIFVGELYSPLLLCLCHLHFNEHSLSTIRSYLKDPSCSAQLPCSLSETNVLSYHTSDAIPQLDRLVLEMLTCLSFACVDFSVSKLWLSAIIKADDLALEESPLQSLDPQLSSVLHLLDFGVCESQLRHYSPAAVNELEYLLHEITRGLAWDLNWCVDQFCSLLSKVEHPALWISESVDISSGFDPFIEAEIDLRRHVVDVTLVTPPLEMTQCGEEISAAAPFPSTGSLEEVLKRSCDLSSALCWIKANKSNCPLDLSLLDPATAPVPTSERSEIFAKFIFHHFLAGVKEFSLPSLSHFLSIFDHLLLSYPAQTSSSPSHVFLGVLSLISLLSDSLWTSNLSEILLSLSQESNLEALILSLLKRYRDGKFLEDCRHAGVCCRGFIRNILSGWFFGWLANHEILVLTCHWVRNGFHELPRLVASLIIVAVTDTLLSNDQRSSFIETGELLTSFLRPNAAPRVTFSRVQEIDERLGHL